MKMLRTALIAAAFVASTSITATAQEPSYTYGSVWEAHGIKVMPGQFENYMDHLSSSWKNTNEMAKREGYIIDYHVLSATHSREGEADLILVVEFKDYITTAQREAFWKKMQKEMSTNDRKSEKEFGERTVMRETLSSSQYQELDLK